MKINNVGRPVRRYVARVAKNGVLSGKTFTAGEKNKATFFRSTAFYPTRDEVDVSSEFSRGSRIVLNTSADRFVLSRTSLETNRFCFVALKKT